MNQQVRLHLRYGVERGLRGQRLDFAYRDPQAGAEFNDGGGWTRAIRTRAAVIRSASLLFCTTAREAPGDPPNSFLFKDRRETGTSRLGWRIFDHNCRRDKIPPSPCLDQPLCLG